MINSKVVVEVLVRQTTGSISSKTLRQLRQPDLTNRLSLPAASMIATS